MDAQTPDGQAPTPMVVGAPPPSTEPGSRGTAHVIAHGSGVPEGETVRAMLRTLAGLPPTVAPDGPVFFEAGPPWGEVLNIAWLAYTTAANERDQAAELAKAKQAWDAATAAAAKVEKEYTAAKKTCEEGLGLVWTEKYRLQLEAEPAKFVNDAIPMVSAAANLQQRRLETTTKLGFVAGFYQDLLTATKEDGDETKQTEHEHPIAVALALVHKAIPTRDDGSLAGPLSDDALAGLLCVDF